MNQISIDKKTKNFGVYYLFFMIIFPIKLIKYYINISQKLYQIMDSFLSCFACGEKSSSSVVVPSSQFTPVKLAQTSQMEVPTKQLDDDKSRVSKTTVTYLTSQTAPTKDQDDDGDIRRRLETLKKKNLPERKAMEAEFVKQNMIKGRVVYLVDKRWSEEYTNFLKDYKIQKMSPINNQALLDHKNQLKSNISQREHYFIITEKVWKFVQALYGGGPTIAKDHTFPVYPVASRRISMPVFGLQNPLNMCYMNSVIQCLLSIQQLNSYFFKKSFIEGNANSESKKKIFHFAYWKIVKAGFETAQSSDSQVNSLKQFLSYFEHKFAPTLQHDIQQFLLYFLEQLQDEMKLQIRGQSPNPDQQNVDQLYARYFQKHRSIIDRIFTGFQETVVICSACDHKSVTNTPFLDLILTITDDNLEQCIKDYFSPQKLTDNYKCQKCGKKSSSVKYSAISKSPNYLILVLKKFKASTLQKIKQRISYPHQLSLKKYCKGHAGDPTYSLQSLIIHKGSKITKGHYYCYTKRNKNQWYLINDDTPKRIETKDAYGRDPYILIFERSR